MRFIIKVVLSLVLLSCSTRSNKDYITLSIPDELKYDAAIVEKLQEDADQLNRVFNSIDDFIEDILSIKEELIEYDSTKSSTILKAKLSVKKLKIQKSQANILYNAAWYFGKDIINKDTILISNLSTDERIIYQKCLSHISVQSDLLDARLAEMHKELKELNELLEKKMPELTGTEDGEN